MNFNYFKVGIRYSPELRQVIRERTGMRSLKRRGEGENEEKMERGHKSLEVAVRQGRAHGTTS